MLKRKDVPQWISAKDDLHKHDLHNVVAVMEAQATLTQGDRVDEGGEEQVDNVFISEIRSELRLGVDLHKSDKGS